MSNHTLFLGEIMRTLKDVKTRNELADYIGVSRKHLSYILFIKKTENLYQTFDIPKKSGGVRHIHAPKKELKQIQRKLADALYEYEEKIGAENKINKNISHAFEKQKSFITNAKVHRNKRFVINIDLKDFFDSFHFGRIRGYFIKNKNYELSEEVATTIAQIACYNSRLPQGAPSSPIITNIICNIFDMRLLNLSRKYKLNYTRYADDLTFSTNDKNFLIKEKVFFEDLLKEITRAGFNINSKKTRIQYKDSHQEVTGIVVNKKLNVNKNYYKQTRAMAQQLYKTGEFFIDKELKGTVNQLEGRFSFINQLDKYNNELSGIKHNFERLNGREKTFSRFLFYKYFFANSKPVIITEGKTDILYLKAALKKLYDSYPELINKNENGQFEYKVHFLKRSKRLEFFLNVSIDGANALKNIVKFYTKNNTYYNHMEVLKNISGGRPLNSVILLYDNEISNSKKPISDLIRNYKNEIDIELLKSRNWINFKDNLYIMVTPLVNGFDESDIEMLFDEGVQNVKIDGRSFDKTGKKDKKEYYNKDIFSKYIMKNYKEINFDRFISVLNNIKEVSLEYKTKMR